MTIGEYVVLGTLVNFNLDIPLAYVSFTSLVTAFMVGVTYLLDLYALRAGYSPLHQDLVVSYLLLAFSDFASLAIILPILVPLSQCLYRRDTPSCDGRAYRAT